MSLNMEASARGKNAARHVSRPLRYDATAYRVNCQVRVFFQCYQCCTVAPSNAKERVATGSLQQPPEYSSEGFNLLRTLAQRHPKNLRLPCRSLREGGRIGCAVLDRLINNSYLAPMKPPEQHNVTAVL